MRNKEFRVIMFTMELKRKKQNIFLVYHIYISEGKSSFIISIFSYQGHDVSSIPLYWFGVSIGFELNRMELHVVRMIFSRDTTTNIGHHIIQLKIYAGVLVIGTLTWPQMKIDFRIRTYNNNNAIMQSHSIFHFPFLICHSHKRNYFSICALYCFLLFCSTSHFSFLFRSFPFGVWFFGFCSFEFGFIRSVCSFDFVWLEAHIEQVLFRIKQKRRMSCFVYYDIIYESFFFDENKKHHTLLGVRDVVPRLKW